MSRKPRNISISRWDPESVIAWLYLNEAQQYKSNRDDVRDERTKYTAIHRVRSTLSIKVVFRDQTSGETALDSLTNSPTAIPTDLETTDIPVKIIPAADATPVEPNFQLIGDVLEHRADFKAQH